MKKVLLLLLIAYCLLLPSQSYAISPYPAPEQKGKLVSNIAEALFITGDPFVYKDIGSLISNILAFGLIIATIMVIIYLLWGGISWITSGGDKGQLEQARNRITSAIIGIFIVAATWAIFLIIKAFLVLPISTPGTTP